MNTSVWGVHCSLSSCQKPWESSECSSIVTPPWIWVNRLAMARTDMVLLVLQRWTEAPDLIQVIEDCHILVTESADTICSCGGKEGEWRWWCCFLGSEAQSKLCTIWSHRITVLLWDWTKKTFSYYFNIMGFIFKNKNRVVLYRHYNRVFHLCLGKKQSLICPNNVQHPVVFLWHLKVSEVTLHYPG